MSAPLHARTDAVAFRRIMRSLWPYARGQSRLLAGAFLALLAEILLRLLEPWPLKIVFDHVIAPQAPAAETRLPLVGSLSTINLLLVAALAIVVVIGARALASFAHTVGFALAGNVTAAVPLVANVLVFASMLGVMFWVRWELALLALAPAPLFFLNSVRLTRRIADVSRKQRQCEGTLAASAAESIAAIRTVQALSLERTFNSTFHDQGKKGLRDGVQAKRLAARLERSMDLLLGIATALVVLYGSVLALRGRITPGDLIVFLAYLKSAFKPVQDFAKYTGRMAKAGAAAERIVAVLDLVPTIRNLPGARPAPPFRGHIRFDRVCFEYDPGVQVLHTLDFQIHGGERVAIVGPSGMGKSTIAGLILRLDDPTSGRVLIDGSDIREYTLESLRGQIAVVLQDSPLFAGSIRDNITIGASATDDQVAAAAALAGADFIESLPRGLDTPIGERGLTLSHGQRQRIAIARAAVRKARIMILDEPTTGLDEESQRIVAASLEALSRDRTLLMVTHDLTLAAQADRVLYIEDGRLLEQGTHEQLLRAGGRYATVFRLQLESPSRVARSPIPDVVAS
jgi:ATP-binding cassette subfamily B protein